MSNGINFYSYMWVSEDIYNITGDKIATDVRAYKNMTLSGSLTIFINTIDDVLIIRARLNNLQEFFGTSANHIKDIVANLDYDTLKDNGQMVDSLKYITSTVDKYNNMYDASLDQTREYLNISDNYIYDMYDIYKGINQKIPNTMEAVLNKISTSHNLPTMKIDTIDDLSYEDVKRTFFQQGGAIHNWAWSQMESFFNDNNIKNDAVRYYMSIACQRILYHLSHNDLESGSTSNMDYLKENYASILDSIVSDISDMCKNFQMQYAIMKNKKIIQTIEDLEGIKEKYQDFVEIAETFPRKGDAKQDDQSHDLDDEIKKSLG